MAFEIYSVYTLMKKKQARIIFKIVNLGLIHKKIRKIEIRIRKMKYLIIFSNYCVNLFIFK